MQIEKELLQGCIEKDRKSQNKLYELIFSYLMNICMRYKNDYDTAGTSLNAIFLKVLDNLDKFENEQVFIPWIKRIAVNHLIDEYRSDKTKKIDYIENYQDYIAPTTAHEKEEQLESEYLLDLIRQLPPTTMRVFNLYALDGYKHREIADLLSISESTSKWHLGEARKRLQVMLEQFKQITAL
tara:strand:- start:480 stop:1028 length:549 start_codon:yes stop_codon:yes gene_type:complete